MSDKEMQVSAEDLQGVKLKETKAKAQEAEMKLVLKCEDGKILDWPSCCGEPMELSDDKMVCTDSKCAKKVDIPTCDNGEKAKPFIVKAK